MGTKPCAGVEIGCDFYETAFFHRANRKARKLHCCYECQRDIQPGEHYEHISAKQDGDIWTAKLCLDCLSVRNTFFNGCVLYGHIWDDFHEHVFNMNGEISEDCLVSLTPAARTMVCEEIEDYWAKYEDDEEE